VKHYKQNGKTPPPRDCHDQGTVELLNKYLEFERAVRSEFRDDSARAD